MRIDTKLNSKALTGANTNVTFERGDIQLEKGRKAIGLCLKLTIPVKNTTGGALALTDANRQLLLGLFLLTMTVGMKSKKLQQPYVSASLARIHHIFREMSNDEAKGYTDSTNGLATSMANNATTNEVLYLIIPTGMAWFLKGKFKNLWGMGPSQCALTEVYLRLTGTNIASGWDINGNVTVELCPVTVPCKGDHWSPLYIYEEKDEVNKVLNLPSGLPLSLHERTQVQASDPLTNLSLKIDDMIVFSQLAAADRAQGFENAYELTASGYPSDRETVVFEQTDGDNDPVRFITGAPRLTQDTKDLATFKAAYLYMPVLSQEDIAAHIAYVASDIREKNVKGVSLADISDLRVPDSLRPFVPFVLVDEQDKEFEQYAGMTGFKDRSPPEVKIPDSMLEVANKRKALHVKHKEFLAASAVEKSVAVQAPGTVENARGLSVGNSALLNGVRRRFIG